MKKSALSIFLLFFALAACEYSDHRTRQNFEMLQSTLENAVEFNKDQSAMILQDLKYLVKKTGNYEKNIALVRDAEFLKKNVGMMDVRLQKAQKRLKNPSKDPWGRNPVKLYMQGDAGKALRDTILSFRHNIQARFKTALFVLDSLTRLQEDFIPANFTNEPISPEIARAFLLQQELALLEFEQTILNRLKNSLQVDPNIPNFDKLVPFASAVSTIVKEGEFFELDIFLANASANLPMKMTANGKPVPVKDGIGKVKIPTSIPGNYTWEGKISFNIKGKDTTFRLIKEYTVIKKPEK
ncbi:MAG: hypothetical protein NW226_01500 [Microscillaceae bacterium]|nr:hypothetical protein [Microscillaceae bacterium]